MFESEKLSLLDVGPDPDAEPPAEVYAAQVESLFTSVGPLLVAIACTILSDVVAVQRTGQSLIGWLAILNVATGAFRLATFRRFRANPPGATDDRVVFAAWERRFGVGAMATAVALGGATFLVFVCTDDPLSQFIVGATAIGYTAGVLGRNFARKAMAHWPVALVLGPSIVGAALRGGLAYEVLAVFTALYWLAAVRITSDLSRGGQRMLTLVLDNKRLAASLTEQNQRLDAALTHMSHGLCLIDAEMRLVLANQRMSELFDIPENALTPGAALADLIGAAASSRRASATTMAAMLNELRGGARQADARLELDDGRVIAWSQSPASNGGAVVIFEDVTDREQARARAEYLSSHDSLTGLPNRMMFDGLLHNAVQLGRHYGKPFCLMFIDLDRFKFVNDTLGHGAGDSLLTEAASRLRESLVESDVVARLGGDEFVAILYDAADTGEAMIIAERVREALAAPYAINGHECTASASIGLAMYPADATDADSLLKCADAAMYQVKQEGKNGICAFSPAMRPPSIKRLELESALRHALERNEFVLHYQPKRSLTTGEATGVEALLRWRHAELGLLGPDKFIDVAEDTGLIVPIGRWVIEAACQQNESWRRDGLPELRVAVNLSPRQFADPDLIGSVERALAGSAMSARLLEIEITESMAMRDFEQSEAIIKQIRALGVRVSIDDFGTGHSSMARLKHLSIDAIKVDRSFVRGLAFDVRDRAIVEAIVALGKALQLDVVGEGVETPEQQALLAECGCDEVQGYLFARPMAAEAIPDFLRERAVAKLAQIVRASRAESAQAARVALSA